MPEPLVLRRANTADVSAIRQLIRSAYAKWVPLIGREPLPMVANHERAVREHIVDLLEKGGELLALIEMILHDDHLLIENVAVRPDQQGSGLGQRILDHADDVARTSGLAEVRLYTNAAFTSNIAFYAKRGFEEYRRGAVVPGSTTVFMRKTLSRGT